MGQSRLGPAEAARVLLPDLGDELVGALVRVEELLMTLAGWEDHAPDGQVVLPGALAGRTALAAVHRVHARIAPTQSRPDRTPPAPLQLLSTDGHRELLALRPVTCRAADLTTLSAAARCLGLAVATGAGTELLDAITVGVEAGADSRASTSDPVELVETFARLNALLQMPPSAGADTLLTRLDGASGPVVLTAEQERAHDELVAHLGLLWPGICGAERSSTEQHGPRGQPG